MDDLLTASSPSLSSGAAAATTPPSSASSMASRRPPRKSTLTQQQKNQKRQRATQDQLITLEVEFGKNPTPTASVRDRIAHDISMTERSVQIWFQNRRAKIKNLAKKSIESGEDCDEIPDSMRRYLAVQALESGNTAGHDLLAGSAGVAYGQANGGMPAFFAADSASGKVVIQHFTCRSLSIGTWRRIGQTAMDLVVFYSPDKACITYYINNGSSGYKIEYPFAYITNISLENGDPMGSVDAAAASQRPAGLLVELDRPPNFFMDDSGSGGFFQCGDFTEDRQASQTLIHHLGGHPKVLSGQLARLVSLEAFRSRHNVAFEQLPALPISAPVSPVNPRPASQPNHLVHPHMALFQNSPLVVVGGGAGGAASGSAIAATLGSPAAMPRGHKRQRSRSVPVAVDLASLRHYPMSPFIMQNHQQQQQQQQQHHHHHRQHQQQHLHAHAHLHQHLQHDHPSTSSSSTPSSSSSSSSTSAMAPPALTLTPLPLSLPLPPVPHSAAAMVGPPPSLYSPVPQHQHHHLLQQQQQQQQQHHLLHPQQNSSSPTPTPTTQQSQQHSHHLIPDLSIDTSAAGYGFDFRQYPPSSASGGSPSDFGTPATAFTTSGASEASMTSSVVLARSLSTSATLPTPQQQQQQQHQHQHHHQQQQQHQDQQHQHQPQSYHIPFLPPASHAGLMQHSLSPLSAMSPADPIIANQSPPLLGMGRHSPSDMYQMAQEHDDGVVVVVEDGLGLQQHHHHHGSYGKGMQLPFRAQSGEEHGLVHELHVDGLQGYGTIDPAAFKRDAQLWCSEPVAT